MTSAQPATPYLFGTEDLKVDNKIVSALCQMCTPDKPVDRTSLFGDFAFSEMCVSDEMTLENKQILEAVRADIQKDFVGRIVQEFQAQADIKPKLGKLAESIDTEYKRLLKAFFLRVRCFIVFRNSTNEAVGRVVAFPDQISDDYGNNLDEHNETGINKMRVLLAQQSNKSRVGSTLYIGHGMGSTMAQICGCLKDAPCVVFDSTFLSEALSRNIFREKLPEKLEMAPRQETEYPWNELCYFFEPAQQYTAVLPTANEIVGKIVDERAAEREKEEKEEKEKQNQNQGKQAKKEGEEEEEEPPKPEEIADAYFAKRVSTKVNGVLSPAFSARAEKTGRFAASMLSDIFMDMMTSFKPGAFPYDLPEKEEEEEQKGEQNQEAQ